MKNNGKQKTVLVIGGGPLSLSEIAISKLKHKYGEDIVIVGSIKEAEEKGYIYHGHTIPEPTDAPSMDPKNIIIPSKSLKYFDKGNTKPIDAIMGKNKKRKKW